MRHLPSILLLMLTWPWIACQEPDDPSVEGSYYRTSLMARSILRPLRLILKPLRSSRPN